MRRPQCPLREAGSAVQVDTFGVKLAFLAIGQAKGELRPKLKALATIHE